MQTPSLMRFGKEVNCRLLPLLLSRIVSQQVFECRSWAMSHLCGEADHNIAKRTHQTQPVFSTSIERSYPCSILLQLCTGYLKDEMTASALTSAACSTNPRQTKGGITERKRIGQGGGVSSTVERSFRKSSMRTWWRYVPLTSMVMGVPILWLYTREGLYEPGWTWKRQGREDVTFIEQCGIADGATHDICRMLIADIGDCFSTCS